MPLVYIILINYNGYKDTIECIESIKKIEYTNYKIIVVDNNSSDDSLKFLKNKQEDFILIESKENLGFAGGNNIGINYAVKNGADYVLLLNNDTIVESVFLGKLIDTFHQDEKVGIAASKIKYYPQKNIIWYGGGKINWFKCIVEHFGMNQIDNGQYDSEKEVDFASGCCILISKEVIANVGILSEEYFMYYEDVDFCVRVKDSGYKILYNPKSIIYHKVSISSGGFNSPFSIKWNTRNRIVFINKFKNKMSTLAWYKTNVFFYGSRLIMIFKDLLFGNVSKAKALIDGVKDGVNYIKVNGNC